MHDDQAAGYLTDVAYIPGFYPNLAPILLRYVASLNRVAPPPGDRFRYLELGCGLGRSLTTLAAANPGGEFIGVDINPEHTAIAAREIEAGRLANARVLTCGFGDIPAELGHFDYIALHGVFSWVAPEIRGQILDVARRHLAPGGLLVVSYNAMPGWAHLLPIRGILRQYAALRQGDSIQRIRDGLAYLVFLRDRQAGYFTANPGAAAYVDSLMRQDLRYLAHEYLNEHWTSFYVTEVADAFAGVGLGFVGSLPIHTNFWDLCVRPEFQELFRTTTNRQVTETHKDFCANTAFRWDVYANSPQPLPDRQTRCPDLHIRLARASLQLPHRTELGAVTSTLQGPVYESLMARLAGGSMPFSTLAADRSVPVEAPEGLARAIDAGVASGLFDISANPVPAAPVAIPARVVIPCPFNRAVLASDALGGRPVALASATTGTGHAISDLEAAILLELTLGGFEGIAERLEARLTAAGRALQHQGQPVADAAERRRLLEEAARSFSSASLPHLMQLGIIAAD